MSNSIDEIKQRFGLFEYHKWHVNPTVESGLTTYDVYCGEEGDTDPESDEAYSVALVYDQEEAELISHVPDDYRFMLAHIDALERIIYECVGLADIMRTGASEELYRDIVAKIEKAQGE